MFEHGLSEQECKEMKGFVDKDLNGIDDRYQLGPVGSNTSSPPHISTAAALLSSAQPLSTPAATHAPTAVTTPQAPQASSCHCMLVAGLY